MKKIANIEMEISNLKTKSNFLLDEIKIITMSEERNRNIITKLKIIYRELINKFERTKSDYGEIEKPISLQLETIEKRFQDFENAMDLNDYIEVEKIVVNLEEMINSMKILLEEVPSVVIMTKVLIPKKIDEASSMYNRMTRDGYPLDYLNIEYNINEINKKMNMMLDKLKLLNLDDSVLELKIILQYFDSLFNDFEKEKQYKNIFTENSRRFWEKIEKINNIVRDIYIQLDDIKSTYDLTEAEIDQFNTLNKELVKLNDDFKVLIEQGKGKTFAYSNLVDELDGLNNRLSKLQDNLDNQLHSISSMKDDETRAKEQLENIQNLLKQAKYKIRNYKLPMIPNSYYIELKEAQDAIREIIRELEKKPIVIKTLNIRVDTARDLAFKLYNTTSEMVKTATLVEMAIVYGNRYRSSMVEIEKGLEKAENLFNKGIYKQAFEITIDAISLIENNIEEKIINKYMEKVND